MSKCFAAWEDIKITEIPAKFRHQEFCSFSVTGNAISRSSDCIPGFNNVQFIQRIVTKPGKRHQAVDSHVTDKVFVLSWLGGAESFQMKYTQ